MGTTIVNVKHKKVLISFQPSMIERFDFIAQCESMTRSELLRQATREFVERWKEKNRPTIGETKLPEEMGPAGLAQLPAYPRPLIEH